MKQQISELSLDQKKVLRDIASWFKYKEKPYLTVGGYAGTGKTTLIAVFRKLLYKHRPKLSVAFVSFTGKASQVLSNKIKEMNAVYDGDSVGTIHSLIYKPNVNSSGQITAWYKNKELEYDLIIVDEASMVTRDIWYDLESYGIPLLAVGDHGQLPPVGDNFNLMENPDVLLQRVHRQAEESPIIKVATMARLNGTVPPNEYSHNVMKLTPDNYKAGDIFDQVIQQNDDTLILCARNKTRIQLNNHIRAARFMEGEEPQINDTLICLKNNYNNADGPIYNGMIGQLKRIRPHEEHWYDVVVDFPSEGKQFDGRILKHQFNQEKLLQEHEEVHPKKMGERFDFGYALTVHKAQGSQAETVLVHEESAEKWMKDSYPRWLYTAITRAVHNLFIIA